MNQNCISCGSATSADICVSCISLFSASKLDCKGKPDGDLVWECAACTYENSVTVLECVICRSLAPAAVCARILAEQDKQRVKESEAASVKLAQTLAEQDKRVKESEAASEELARMLARGPDVDSDFLLAVSLESNDVEARVRAELKDVGAAPNVYRCPWCNIPVSIQANEINCSIFICGATRDFMRGASSQLAQHDESRASAALAAGEVVAGCGKQFRLVSGGLERCTGK